MLHSGTDVVSQSGSATSKPEGGGAHGLVGRPPTGPIDLLLVAVGCSQGPLVNGLWIGFFPAGFLLWWPFGPCVATSGQCLLLGTKGVIALHFQLNPALIET